ncbi:MAG TPA: NrtA/SsuA/CpmA family ABC transporter substrate-binding protein [Syntrophorhabdaceae bacterium]|jgi:NitT/TauT family transport system substrate-binding protein
MGLLVLGLATGACLFACTRTEDKPAGPPEKITIAYSATTDAALAEVAQSRGFYREEGLEAIARVHPYGKLALEDLLAGKADFATVAETPIVFAIMKGEKISIIATIQTSEVMNAVLARKDKGVRSPGDLKGKKIAATLGTTSDFFLDALLGVHGISRKEVTIVDLKAEAMPAALAQGKVDAVSTFAPYVALTQKKLGKNVTTFRDKDIYRSTFNVITTQEFIRKNPEKVKKMLRALVKAERFVRANPAEAQKIVADFCGVELSVVRDIWADTRFAVMLDQPLLLAMEDESRWAIDNRLTRARMVPNYLQFIHIDGLKSIKPEVVRILR